MAEDSSAKANRVVVVDDSSTVLRVMESILRQHGYEAHSTDDGSNAVDLVREVMPDLIFVDFAMPGVNGFEVCQRLGEHPDLESIPIVIMSTKGDPIGDRFVREMGIVDHITKPFAPEALIALVEHCLNRAKLPRPTRRREVVDTSLAEQLLAKHLGTLAGVEPEKLREALRSVINDPEWVEEARRLLQLADGTPALAGDIAQCGLSEVLQMIGLQRQTGRFTVRSRNVEIIAWFRMGSVRLVTGTGIEEEHMLGSILVRQGRLSADQLGTLLKQRKTEGRRFGASAIEAGWINDLDLERAMRAQSSELVYELLRFGTGSFDFMRYEELPEWVLEFGFALTVDELLMEGFRRVDEWGLIETAIPSFDSVPEVRVEAPETLTEVEQRVYRSIDGSTTVRAIIDESSLGTFEGARVLYRLVSSRVVTLRTQAGNRSQNIVG